MNTNTTDTNTTELAAELLAKWLGVEREEIEEARFDSWGLTVLEVGGDSYAVGTDEESDAACSSYVEDTLWAFRGDFIAEACGFDSELGELFSAYSKDKCEDANKALLSLVKKTCGLGEFVRRAVAADGRGHFLASYDGDEISLGNGMFAYRIG